MYFFQAGIGWVVWDVLVFSFGFVWWHKKRWLSYMMFVTGGLGVIVNVINLLK